MANSNTFVDGYTSGGEQVTTLSQVQGAGLTIPSGDFIKDEVDSYYASMSSGGAFGNKKY